MGCKNQGDVCDTTDHCQQYVPLPADQKVTVEFTEYPVPDLRSSNINFNMPRRDGIAVMYPSLAVTTNTRTGGTPSSAAICGKASRTVSCFGADEYYYGYRPNELSFDLMFSDRFFSYLYDTSDDAGHVGIACYYLQTRTNATTGGTPDPVTGDPDPPDSTEESTVCKPCTAFSCAPAKTNLTYTVPEGNITGDPDAPHPTLYGIGTDTNKLCFSYVSLSTTLPNGVTDLEMSYDGVTWTDVWDEGQAQGVNYDTSQNPFTTGEDPLEDFQIYDLDSGTSATGFRVKLSISAIADLNAPDPPGPTFSGVRWRILELMTPGQGYTAGTTFDLSFPYTDANANIVNLTVKLRIKSVGPIQAVGSAAGFDVLRIGDTINGHTITHTFHTDLDNFPYHVVYLDGNGSNFTKDTNYTSSRNHVISAKAGYGIVDRAILVGVYEFLDKSTQFTTNSIAQNAPNVFNDIFQPDVSVTITNGSITGTTINLPGVGLDKVQGGQPTLGIAGDPAEGGTKAEVEGTFVNGELTAIKIVKGGSGYSADNPPQIYVNNTSYRTTQSVDTPGYDPSKIDNALEIYEKMPDGPAKPSKERLDKIRAAYELPPTQVSNAPEPSFLQKLDPTRLRLETMPQKSYSQAAVDEWRANAGINNDDSEDISNLNVPEVIQDKLKARNEYELTNLDNFGEKITQKVIPAEQTKRTAMVETVQGPFSDLPVASEYTKYMIRQFKPDTTPDVKISVTLSCEVAQEGCGHVPCSPTGETGGTTNNADGTTTTTSYSTLVGPLGGGCQNWSASGEIDLLNDMTGTTFTLGLAIGEYGNPYDE